MKKTMLSILALLLITAGCQKQNISSVIAVACSDKLTIDGKLDDTVWQRAERLDLKNSDTGEEITDDSFSTYASVCYDSAFLYIAFSCNDKDIYSSFTERDQYLWEEEAVEVFIDVDDNPNSYVEIEVAPTNIIFDSFIVDPYDIDIPETLKYDLVKLKTAVLVGGTVNQRDDTDQMWSCEIAVPFDEIVENYEPSILKTASWKINFYRIDNDADGPVDYAWSPTGGRFHNPAVFGTLVFK